MDDDKSKSKDDSRVVSRTQRYDVAYFAKKHGLSIKDAQRIVNTHGADRDSADRAAIRFKQ